MQKTPKILLFGYGNPGREDDGLGNAFIEFIEPWIKEKKLSNIEVDSNYQLNIEDSETISDKDIVVFIDATIEPIDAVILTRVDPSEAKIEFTMHASSPSFILDLCNKLYNKNPETYVLRIKGYEWEFKEGLTPKAHSNLLKALDFMKDRIKDPASFKSFATSPPSPPSGEKK
ncbi:MAG: hydrogenase maturation protease [Bacteroidales bacterium]|nr:hydrogenase maturation protease [Bacteroidales bacterium]